jgi:hypothetical protein
MSRGQHAVGSTEQRRKAQVDEVNARDAKRHVPGQRDALIQEMVDHIQDGLLRRIEHVTRGRPYVASGHEQSIFDEAVRGPWTGQRNLVPVSEQRARLTRDEPAKPRGLADSDQKHRIEQRRLDSSR